MSAGSAIGRAALAVAVAVVCSTPAAPRAAGARASSVLDHEFLVTWYGNPRSTRMGILGEQSGEARASALRKQADAYVPLTDKTVVPAYHLVAVVAQCTAGKDALWRRRETADVIRDLLIDARAHGFRLILDVQPGRATVEAEVNALAPFLAEPDMYLALDPEFTMSDCEVPGRQIGQMAAADISRAASVLSDIIDRGHLPPKVLIVHQFRLDMLPDKRAIGASPNVDLVLMMDGFGSRSLKRDSYRTVFRQAPLEFAGIKLFFRQDTNLMGPADVLAMTPRPSVVIYQ